MPLEVAENRRSRLSSAYRDAQADAGLCTGCERCWEVCWYNAISMLSGAAVKSDACVGCGYCFQVCPTGALEALLGDVLASASFD